MIIDISDIAFKRIFRDEKLYLPIRWTGDDFVEYLKDLLNTYQHNVYYECIMEGITTQADSPSALASICDLLIKAIEEYLNGFPANAYSTFQDLMKRLNNSPLRINYKSRHGVNTGYSDSQRKR